eukprot:g3258.t1
MVLKHGRGVARAIFFLSYVAISLRNRSVLSQLLDLDKESAHPFDIDSLEKCTDVGRTCRAFENPKDFECTENLLNAPTIVVSPGNWESSVHVAWVFQIIASEYLHIPVYVTPSSNGISRDFYSTATWDLGDMDYDWDGLRRGNEKITCMLEEELTHHMKRDSCVHILIDVWESQAERVQNFTSPEGFAELLDKVGYQGGLGWYTHAHAVNKLPALATYRGLQDPEV